MYLQDSTLGGMEAAPRLLRGAAFLVFIFDRCYTFDTLIYMPTTKKRINITTDANLEKYVRLASKRDKMSMSSKVVDLLWLALELEEDMYFGKLAELRSKEKGKSISHEEAWKGIA